MSKLCCWSVVLGLLAFGCGDDDSRPAGDAGPIPGVDAGPIVAVDSGPIVAVDAGPVTGVDAGGGGGNSCPSGACDLLTNAGCEAGQGCYFVTTAEGTPPSPMCLPAGTGAEGATCENSTMCQEGFICVDSECRPVCCTEGGEGCPVGQACLTTLVDPDTGDPTGVGACSAPDGCVLLTQTGCPDGEGCYPAGGDGSTSCVEPAMNGMQGATCGFSNDCAPGFICLGDGTCAQVCQLPSGDPMCPDGLTCGGVTGFPADTGVCTGG